MWTRIGKSSPPPIQQTQPKPIEVPVEEIPGSVRAAAQRIDEKFGDGNLRLSLTEMKAFSKTYGTDSDTRQQVIHPLSLALAERLAAEMVEVGGTATAEDAALVAADLKKVPAVLLQTLRDNGVRVIVCRDTVTEVATELKGLQPRGWPPDATWDEVTGVFSPSRNSVIIATEESKRTPGRRVLPRTGSVDTVLHETGHGIDRHDPAMESVSASFQSAYGEDQPALAGLDNTLGAYLLQPGEAGAQESFAESFAAFFSSLPDANAKAMPQMLGFWSDVQRRADQGLI